MVVKTETCFFTERRIYPGHGARFVRRDGKLLIFISSTARRHYNNRKKAMRLRWTLAWRRAHKKFSSDRAGVKRLAKKTTKVFKTFAGISVEDLKAKSDAQSDLRKTEAQKAERARADKKTEKAKATAAPKKAAPKAKTAAAAPRAKPVYEKVSKMSRQRAKVIAGHK